MGTTTLRSIVPPRLLHQLLTHDDPAGRNAARQTLLQTALLREQRAGLDRPRSGTGGRGLHRSIYDARGEFTSIGTLVRDEGDPPVPDGAVNDVYDAFEATYALYSDVYDRDSIDGAGQPLVGVTHYGRRFNNAFWNGARMVFGDGDGMLFVGFTKATDVIGHELTHGVTECTSALTYHGQSGALNESFSDVFGSLVKQYALRQRADQADWLIGAGTLGPAIRGKALRSMAAPGTAFPGDDQPGHMAGYVELPDNDAGDNAGVHTNSGIPNHAFYILATLLGGYAWETAGQIWYDTLRTLTPHADFADCASASWSHAGRRFGAGSREQHAVAHAWDAVGITIAKRKVPEALAADATRR
jgi:Zn-dependent metalloprotease